MAKLVLTYAKKVLSEAKWSRATLPEFFNVSEAIKLSLNVLARRDDRFSSCSAVVVVVVVVCVHEPGTSPEVSVRGW